MDGNSKSKFKVNSKNLATYKSKMEEIKFLAEHINDIPDIFGGDPMKCKLFLIKVFTALDSNLYYLSLLSNDAIDQELLKAACILQIHVVDSSKKTTEVFQNMNEKDIHKFWMRLFKICKICDTELESNSFCIDNNDIKFNSRFCNVKEALEYCNYGISMINPAKIDETVIYEEINSWNDVIPPTEFNNEESFHDDSQLQLQENIPDIPDVTNLYKNINYIENKMDMTNSTQNYTPDNKYTDFFVKFNEAVKEISSFENNMNFISSVVIENVLNASVFNGLNLTRYKNQIKRCNDLIESIKEKKKCQSNS